MDSKIGLERVGEIKDVHEIKNMDGGGVKYTS